MIDPNLVLRVLVAASCVVAFAWLGHLLMTSLRAPARQRLALVRTTLVLVWSGVGFSLVSAIGGLNVHYVGFIERSNSLRTALETSNRVWLESAAEGFGIVEILVFVWAIGFAVSLLRIYKSWREVGRILRESRTVEVAGRSVQVSAESMVPFSYGLYMSRICIPEHVLAKRAPDEIESILVHEETHLRHRDSRWKLASLMTGALLFFLPLVRSLHRRFELDMEIECDRVTMERRRVTALAYGGLLLDSARDVRSEFDNPLLSFMSHQQLRRRIEAMMAKSLKRTVWSASLTLTTMFVALSAFALATPHAVPKPVYEVQIDFTVGGKVVATPMLRIFESEAATMEIKSGDGEELRLRLVASESVDEQTPDAIDLKMNVEFEDAGRSVKANPRMVITNGGKGTITVGSRTDDVLEMKVRASRL